MSNCEKLFTGYSLDCAPPQRKFWQRAVLLNKSDVAEYLIARPTVSPLGVYSCAHHIRFKLTEGATGFEVKNLDTAFNVFGTSQRSEKNDTVQHSHSIQFALMGAEAEIKCFLGRLEQAFYFAALMYTDGTVEIYGFENGLKPDNYTIDLQNTAGGTIIKLQSPSDEQEQDLPYLYRSMEATPEEDFDNLFAGITVISGGDFNNDFNNDFFI